MRIFYSAIGIWAVVKENDINKTIKITKIWFSSTYVNVDNIYTYICILLKLESTSIASLVIWKRGHQTTLIYNVSETFLFIDLRISMAIGDLEQIFSDNLI